MKKISTLLFAIFAIFTLNAQTYYENFESLVKTSYGSGEVELTDGVRWEFTAALKGDSKNEVIAGKVSVRMAGVTKETSNTATPKMEMLANKPGGIGQVTFQYRAYTSAAATPVVDAQIKWIIEWSSDGATWTKIGEIEGTAATQTFNYNLNKADARIRITTNEFEVVDSKGQNGKRVNIDELTLTDYDASSINFEKDKDKSLNVISKNGILSVTTDGLAKTVEVFNILGQRIATKVANSTTTDIAVQAGQVVIVKVGKDVKKVVTK